MPSVFISYRRDDSAGEAGRLADALEARFGKDRIWRDVEDIPAGRDFAHEIDNALAQADVLLVVIGRDWLSVRNAAGRRRLDDPQDFVRLEIESALTHGLRVLPVLVRGTAMPTEGDLPESLRPLVRIQAHEVSDSRWDYDVGRLMGLLEEARGWQGAMRRHWRLALLGLAGVAVAAGLYVWSARPSDVAGVWYMTNGNVWAIVQDGRQLRVDETHRDSHEVWRKGVGEVNGKRLSLSLDLVFQQGYHYTGELELVDSGASMTGTLTLQRDGRSEPLTLTRQARP